MLLIKSILSEGQQLPQQTSVHIKNLKSGDLQRNIKEIKKVHRQVKAFRYGVATDGMIFTPKFIKIQQKSLQSYQMRTDVQIYLILDSTGSGHSRFCCNKHLRNLSCVMHWYFKMGSIDIYVFSHYYVLLLFWTTYLRRISTSFFTESGNPLFRKFCRASTVAASTFGFRTPRDRTNSGASFTSESIQQHINCNLGSRKKKALTPYLWT